MTAHAMAGDEDKSLEAGMNGHVTKPIDPDQLFSTQQKLLLNFATDYNEVANEIREALDAKDFDQAHSLVHNLKGLAGSLAATHLQAAAMSLEKFVKGVGKKATPSAQLNLRLSELENTLNQALESAQSLGVSAQENHGKLSAEEIVDIPTELSQDYDISIRPGLDPALHPPLSQNRKYLRLLHNFPVPRTARRHPHKFDEWFS